MPCVTKYRVFITHPGGTDTHTTNLWSAELYTYRWDTYEEGNIETVNHNSDL